MLDFLTACREFGKVDELLLIHIHPCNPALFL